MARYDYDLFVIGAGSGGVRAARFAAAAGARVAICEESRVGGTCVIRGCIPKKLLVHAAHYRDDFEDARAYGWDASLPTFDWPLLIANKNREIDRLNGIYIGLLRNSGVELIEGRGRLADRHTVEVAGRAYTAETILVATGSWPTVPPIDGAEGCMTSNEALELADLPRRLLIVGGGYIAVELAGVFANLGVEVSMAVRGEELLNGFDDDIRIELARAMRDQGVVIHTRTELESLARSEAGVTARTRKGQDIDVDEVLYATGRRPLTRDMGLAEAGVDLREDGAVEVDALSRTSVANIYAIGDCTDRMNLTPVALHEAMCFVQTVFRDNPTKPVYEDVPTAVFSTPAIGTAGLTEAQARKTFGKVDVYKSRFRPLKHTLTGRQEFTLMKLLVEPKSDRVVGLHMIGADAAEIVQGFGVAMKCGATKAQFDATIGIHPSSAEEFVTMRTKEPEPEAKAAE
ncbi:MAG: glutathione-disulfide reductase [Alphaproteobacteria bacterium]